MTIASELTKLNTNLTNSYTAVSDKGGILPQTHNFDNLATAVSSITASNNTTLNVTPTTSAQNLTPTSPYNGFSSVSVSAVTSSIDSNISAGNIKKNVVILGVTGTYEGEDSDYNFSYRLLIDGTIQPSVSAITYEGYLNDTSIEGLNWCITKINARAERMFRGCTNLKFVNFPKLKDINYPNAFFWMFRGCTSLQYVSFPKLKTITQANGYMFYECSSLKYLDFPVLTGIYGTLGTLTKMFYGCSSLEYVSFPALSYIESSSENTFDNCTNLKHIIFGALNAQSFGNQKILKTMMTNTGTTTTHTIHFPSNLESTISSLTGYPLFGGTSGYVVLAYDLPATS